VNEKEKITQIIEHNGRPAVLRIRKARLVVVEGPDRGLEHDIGAQAVTVGTAPECDLVLGDPSVSRRHFEIAPSEDGFRMRDFESTNGTRVRGVRIAEALLAADEEIAVGDSRIQLVLLQGRHELPLSHRSSFGALAGRSAVMRQLFATLSRVAPTGLTVLLEGESGTGKDLAAEMIHQASDRGGRPLVVVDCAAIQPNLMESELFGHVRGAFTGADHDRPGAFEVAQGGTVFLDEVGELPLSLQPKLLRVLERLEVRRVGDVRYRRVDTRLVAATNRNLDGEVAAGRFREDLYFRVAVVRIRMPALRDHPEDIGALARRFVQKLRPDLDPVEVISDDVLSMLISHRWPGNVRELHNVVSRLLVFPGRTEEVFDGVAGGGPQPDLLGLPFHLARGRWNDHFERTYLANVLDRCAGVVTRAAERAEIPRQTFHRLMKKHGLTR
jgi:transcriptional regulator with GAF, ATPase, and Fis domain